MENKKNLKVNCAVCDVRNITEDLLSTYAQVAINSATIITNPAAQALLGRYGVKINAASTLNLEGDNGGGRPFRQRQRLRQDLSRADHAGGKGIPDRQRRPGH